MSKKLFNNKLLREIDLWKYCKIVNEITIMGKKIPIDLTAINKLDETENQK